MRKEKGPHEPGDPSVIANEFSIDENSFTDRYVLDLQTLGLIELPYAGNIAAHITPKGMALVDRENPFVKGFKSADIRNIEINAPVTGSAIVQGDNSTVSVAFNFIDKLEKEIQNSTLPEEEKKTWIGKIKELSTHPILVEALKTVLMSGAL